MKIHPRLGSKHPNFGLFFSAVSLRSIGGVVAVSVASNILLLVMPLFSLQVFDRVMVSRNLDTLIFLSLGAVIALLIFGALDSLRGMLLSRIANQFEHKFAEKIIGWSVAKSSATGIINHKEITDIQTIKSFVSQSGGLSALIDAPWAILFVVVTYLMHPYLGLLMVVVAAVLAGITASTEWLTQKSVTQAGELSFMANSRASEMMRAASLIEGQGMLSNLRQQWVGLVNAAACHSTQSMDRSVWLQSLAKSIRYAMGMGLYAMGAWLFLRGELSSGAMVAANILSARGLSPLEAVIGGWRSLTNTRNALARLVETENRHDMREESSIAPTCDTGSIQIESVIYAYSGQQNPLIKGVSMEISGGKTVVMMGASASGKSTLGKLITGAIRPSKGRVRIDGGDVWTWPRDDFAKHVGYLPQEPILFEGTVAQNIARFSSDAQGEQVTLAAKMAGAHELILALPKGYDTPIIQGGANLSGGQKQRIALARAFFGDPKVLVLDEPNSALDTDGERALTDSLIQAKRRGATIILVIQRLGMLGAKGLIDTVIMMREGLVEKAGPPEMFFAVKQAPKEQGVVNG